MEDIALGIVSIADDKAGALPLLEKNIAAGLPCSGSCGCDARNREEESERRIAGLGRRAERDVRGSIGRNAVKEELNVGGFQNHQFLRRMDSRHAENGFVKARNALRIEREYGKAGTGWAGHSYLREG